MHATFKNQPGSPPSPEGKGKVKTLPKVKPMLAIRMDNPFDHPDWIYELNQDGCRALAAVHESSVQLYNRNFSSFAASYPAIAEELKQFKQSVILDGEIVVEKKEDGFGETNKQSVARYHVFDIIHLNGYNLFEVPLIKRKELLKSLLESYSFNHLVYTEHVRRKGTELFEEAVNKKLEGIVARNAFSPYRMDSRTRDWFKIKVLQCKQVVIAGMTAPKGDRSFFNALLLAISENNTLKYVGQCENGFTEKSREKIYNVLSPYISSESPLVTKINPEETVQWLQPRISAEIFFDECNKEGLMRYIVFSRLLDGRVRTLKKTPPEN